MMTPMADTTPRLTEGERRFCVEYAADPNGTKAYRLAYPNHTDTTARNNAARLIAKAYIRAEIRRLRRGYERRVGTSAARLNLELKRAALYDPADAFDRDPHGGPLLPRPLHDIPADTRRAIQSVKVRRRRIAGGGDEVYEVEEVEYKFADKAAANKALGKRLGYDETDAQTGGGGGVIEIPENGRDTPAGG